MMDLGLSISLSATTTATPTVPVPQAGLAAWYDPSDLSSLWQDVACTIPVTTDGDPVAVMLDKSGNGFDLSQSISANRPTYHTEGALHWLHYDGQGDTLSCAIGPSNNPGHFGLAFALDGFPTAFSNIMSNGADMPRFYISQSGEKQIRGFWGDQFLYVSRSTAFTAIGPTSMMSWVDGTNSTLMSGGQTATASAVTISSVDGPLILGEPNFNGRIFAMTYHSTVLDAGDSSTLANYLAQRTGT